MSTSTGTTLTEERRLELLEERQRVSGKTIKIPQVRSYNELFETLAVWDHDKFNPRNGVVPEGRPPATILNVTCRECGGSGQRATARSASGRELDRHERSGTPCQYCKAGKISIDVGPFCVIERPKQRFSLAVKSHQVVLDALEEYVMGDANESWSLRIIDHGNVALVIAESSLILSSIWLAYIDPLTIPIGAELLVHKAEPATADDEERGAGHCKRCGARVKRVPGGRGPTWVHEDSGAVAAPNPPEGRYKAWLAAGSPDIYSLWLGQKIAEFYELTLGRPLTQGDGSSRGVDVTTYFEREAAFLHEHGAEFDVWLMSS